MAAVRLPQIVSDVNVFVDGIGFAGVVDKENFKLPEIEEMTETIKNGGFERSYGVGVFKKLEFEFTLKEIHPIVYTALGTAKKTGKGAMFICKGNAVQDGEKKQFIATLTSSNFAISHKGADTTLKGEARFYMFEFAGTPLCIMDTDNLIANIGGIDYLEEVRKNIL
jgi:P2 family phage contractile tail tube protein